jgi:hypothetical protein
MPSRWRRPLPPGLKVKAGAKFSKATKDAMVEACKSIMSGHDAISEMLGDASDDDADVEDDTSKSLSTSDTDKSADELRQKRLREVDLLGISAA